MPKLRYQDFTPGTRVKRVEGEGEQEKDISREGVVIEPTGYNSIANTLSVRYVARGKEPEKTDSCCTPFEFEIIT